MKFSLIISVLLCNVDVVVTSWKMWFLPCPQELLTCCTVTFFFVDIEHVHKCCLELRAHFFISYAEVSRNFGPHHMDAHCIQTNSLKNPPHYLLPLLNVLRLDGFMAWVCMSSSAWTRCLLCPRLCIMLCLQ